MLDVYIDFKSPEAYLAFAPTLALQERGIAVRWLPYNTVQRGIPELPEQATKGDIHRRIRAELRVSTHQLYAKLRKLPMHFRDQPGVTDKALAALAHQPFNAKFVELAFDAYWNAQRDLDDASRVDELLERSGADLKICRYRQRPYTGGIDPCSRAKRSRGVRRTSLCRSRPTIHRSRAPALGHRTLSALAEALSDASAPNG